jgi:hypothetical protein
MDPASRLFDRIRVRPRVDQPQQAEGPRCEATGCTQPGLHRAPKGRGFEGQYWRFCIDHVKAYNQTYNYFAGMSDDDVAAYQKDAATGHRPTWSMGVNPWSTKRENEGVAVDDPFDVAGIGPRAKASRKAPEQPRWKIQERKALEQLDLPETATRDMIKARYKELVKRLHPDANGGDRSSETRLQDVIVAYKTLMSADRRAA